MSPSVPHPSGILQRLARLRRDRRGVAAVEFAMILPILITFYLGLTEVQPGISIKRKLSLVTRTLADLSTRSADLTKDELKNIFGASVAIMRPYDETALTQMVVTSVAVTKNGTAYTGTVEWSCGWNLKSDPENQNLETRATKSAYTVPSGFQNEATKSFVLVETQYPYKPTFGLYIIGTLRLKDTSPWPVRDADRVKTPTGTAATGMDCKT